MTSAVVSPFAALPALRVLVVDDEALARTRLCELLAECRNPAAQVLGQAAHAEEALAQLRAQAFDVVLLDIHMPGTSGLALAQALRKPVKTQTQTQPSMPPPAVVFVTAHAEHALTAFELEATDYLTKPVRLERLQTALQKVARAPAPDAQASAVLHIQERNRLERLPLREVLYLKAELKYITVRTAQRSYVLDGALSDLEARFGGYFVRIHRNALVAAHAVRALEKQLVAEDAEGWALRLEGVEERLLVSRRHIAALRDLLAGR